MSSERDVEVQDATGKWWPALALTGERYDYKNAIRRDECWLSVLVDLRDGTQPINWPAEHVRDADELHRWMRDSIAETEAREPTPDPDLQVWAEGEITKMGRRLPDVQGGQTDE